MPSRRCPHCKVVSSYSPQRDRQAPFDVNKGKTLEFQICQNTDCGNAVVALLNGDGSIADVYPALEEEPDDLLPDDVKKAFRQALQSLNERIWDGSVTMARRALQEAVVDLDARGDNLYAQIENLAKEGKITPDLKEWAHEGRLGGNLGAHGDRERKWNEQADAEEIVEFAKWFFRYVYILPKQLAQRRGRLAGEVPPPG